MKFSRWEYTRDYNRPPWAMDERHIRMVEAVVRLSGVERAVEIGCLNGRSTTAFVAAKENGASLKWMGLCDINPQDGIFKIEKELNAAGVVTHGHWFPSDTFQFHADLWLIDGDHTEQGVGKDYDSAKMQGARIIILHDTSHRQFDAPGKLLARVRGDWAAVYEDKEKREGEETERGIAFLFNWPAYDIISVLKTISCEQR